MEIIFSEDGSLYWVRGLIPPAIGWLGVEDHSWYPFVWAKVRTGLRLTEVPSDHPLIRKYTEHIAALQS